MCATPPIDDLDRRVWHWRVESTVAARDFARALGKPHSMIDLDTGDALALALACAGYGRIYSYAI
jgi:hypothetical protein